MIYFTADTHFAHEGVMKFSNRPFKTIEDHDAFMIEMLNRYVDKKDMLYILGDFAWKYPQKYLPKINCKNKIFIRGNHDPNNLKTFTKNVCDVKEIKVRYPDNAEKRIKIFLSHYPHAYWPSSHYGSFHLYGHCHTMREDTLDSLFPDRRSMDVGVDNALRLMGEYKPFSMEVVYDILSVRKNHDPVEWYRERYGQI